MVWWWNTCGGEVSLVEATPWQWYRVKRPSSKKWLQTEDCFNTENAVLRVMDNCVLYMSSMMPTKYSTPNWCTSNVSRWHARHAMLCSDYDLNRPVASCRHVCSVCNILRIVAVQLPPLLVCLVRHTRVTVLIRNLLSISQQPPTLVAWRM